jgi:ATP-binding cassette subfamily B protein
VQPKKRSLLMQIARGDVKWTVTSVIAAALASFFALLSPLLIGMMIDSVLGEEPFRLPQAIAQAAETGGLRDVLRNNLLLAAAIVLVAALGNALFVFLRGYTAQKGAEGFIKKLRDRLMEHLQQLPFDYHVKSETGDIIQRCTTDVETLRRFTAAQISEFARAVTLLVLALLLMLGINGTMTLATMALVPIVAVISVLYARYVEKHFRAADEAEGVMSAVVQENLSGVRVVRAFGRQCFEREKFERENEESTRLFIKVNNAMGYYWGATDAMGYIQVGVSLVVGTLLCVRGAISVGDLVVFISYAGMLVWPVRQMGRILADFSRARVSWERLAEILEAPAEDIDEGMPFVDGDIAFSHVSFAYEPGHPVLCDVSFNVKKGQTIAILGATGSGKSSLVHLLARLYEPDSGTITVAGRNIANISKRAMRENVGLVLQESFLYARTLRENIALTRPEATGREVEEVVSTAALADVVAGFSQGLDTVVGERGITLSGGQKQRVAIARTLLRDTPILIFDDSLSAVDTRTDAAIRRALTAREKKKTTFIISHRIRTLMQADWILVFEGGCVVQQGTSQSLLAEEGLFRDIYKIQDALTEEIRSYVTEEEGAYE